MNFVIKIIGPAMILLIIYATASPKPAKFSGHIKLLFRHLATFWGYAFFLYFAEAEGVVTCTYSFMWAQIILIPVSTLVVLLRGIYWYKSLRAKRTSS